MHLSFGNYFTFFSADQGADCYCTMYPTKRNVISLPFLLHTVFMHRHYILRHLDYAREVL